MVPEAGPHHPVVSLPPGAVRRTTVVDTAWADWDTGRTRLSLRASDSTGESVAFTVDVEMAMGEILATDDGPEAIVGATLRAGWGRFLAATFPEEAAARTLTYSLLDDLNGAFFVAGYAALRDGIYAVPPDRVEEAAARQADVCIGWATGSDMYVTLTTKGYNAVPVGPVAPVLDDGGASLGVRDMRRRRTLDVSPRDDGGFDVVSHFRDSYQADDHEMVLHEWLLSATVHDGVITSIDAEPRTLPWRECPGASASASAVVGTTLATARRDLVGPTTCTHLTSTLRALADVQALQALTQPRGSGMGRSV